MSKKLPVILMLALIFSVMQTPAAAQDAAFTIQTIRIENMFAYDLKVSPDGRTAAVYAGITSLILLNVPTAEYTVDESFLPIRLIDLTTGKELARLTGPTDYVSDVAFTPDGRRLASYHRNGEIYLWDIASGKQLQRLNVIMGSPKLEFLPDGKTLAVYMAEGIITYFLLWDMETGYMTRVWRPSYKSFGDLRLSRAPANLDYRYAAFDISPDGALLATATANGELALWDTATLEQTIVQPKADKEGMFNIRSVVFSADGKTLIYYDSLSEQTHFWDVASQSEAAVISGGSPFFGVSPASDALVWATRKEVWFVRLDQPNIATKVLDFPDNLLVATPLVTFTPDGSRIIVGGFGSRGSMADSFIYVIALR